MQLARRTTSELFIRTAVVADQRRADAAHALQDKLSAQFLHMDNGFWGCKRSHIRCWEYLADQDSEWSLVVEDDAQPVESFTTQLADALTKAPASVVSLYLGTGFPPQWQDRIHQAITAAEREQAHWISADNHLHGVAVAIKTELVRDMLTTVRCSTQPIDYAIRDWAKATQHKISFSHPSLVDHADTPSLTAHPDGGERTIPRKAWRVGTREAWTSRQVTL
jgi:GR25 family glycosyltransferase involved in LPS biosynthesis